MVRHAQYRFSAAAAPNAARREWTDAVEVEAKGWAMIQIGIDPGVYTGVAVADDLELAGAQVERVHPPGKVDAATFTRITGWTGRTNEHQRDAGILAITTTRGRK